jgi:hypothetical protein
MTAVVWSGARKIASIANRQPTPWLSIAPGRSDNARITSATSAPLLDGAIFRWLRTAAMVA